MPRIADYEEQTFTSTSGVPVVVRRYQKTKRPGSGQVQLKYGSGALGRNIYFPDTIATLPEVAEVLKLFLNDLDAGGAPFVNRAAKNLPDDNGDSPTSPALDLDTLVPAEPRKLAGPWLRAWSVLEEHCQGRARSMSFANLGWRCNMVEKDRRGIRRVVAGLIETYGKSIGTHPEHGVWVIVDEEDLALANKCLDQSALPGLVRKRILNSNWHRMKAEAVQVPLPVVVGQIRESDRLLTNKQVEEIKGDLEDEPMGLFVEDGVVCRECRHIAMKINYGISRTTRQPHRKNQVECKNGSVIVTDGDWESRVFHDRICATIYKLHPGWSIVGYCEAPKDKEE